MSSTTTTTSTTTSATTTPEAISVAAVVLNDDWEEWDGTTPFWHHCLAGSFAGVAEHGLVYPLDTVRTHLQVCANCPNQSSHPQPYPHPQHPLQQQASSFGGGSTSISSSSSSRAAASPNTTTSSAAYWRSSFTSLIRPSVTANTTSAAAATTAVVHHHHPYPYPQGMWGTMRHLMSLPAPTTTAPAGAAANSILSADVAAAATSSSSSSSSSSLIPPLRVARLWRGVQTILLGCIPAHALYFSSYEAVKYSFTTHHHNNNNGSTTTTSLPYYGSMLAGATATISHDIILTPLDTIKQRLQLGHYQGMAHAFSHMIQYEGWNSLYRSFSITLLTNIPYGMIMVTTNESCKALFLQRAAAAAAEAKYNNNNHNSNSNSTASSSSPPPTLTWTATVVSSSFAGMMASFWTTPLDRIKTYLQVQQLQPACHEGSCPLIGGGNGVSASHASPHHNNNNNIASWPQALQRLLQQPHGVRGLWHGALPRVLSHTPSVAISWTTYEAAKQYLAAHYHHQQQQHQQHQQHYNSPSW